MANTQRFQPDWTSPPGDTIADAVRERGMTLAEFAERMSAGVAEVEGLIHGRIPISIKIARQLRNALGGSVEFWVSRDFQYREDVARSHRQEEAQWLKELPIRDMVASGWLVPFPNAVDELRACLSFFDVPSVDAWRERFKDLRAQVAFRTSRSFESREGATAAWLRQGEIQAGRIECRRWNQEGFRNLLPDLRILTKRKDPAQFLPDLEARCAEQGVAAVVVRAPNGCRASGATRFLSPKKALLLLSFRHLTDDHFWFTFFHEAGHLVLHDPNRLFLEGLEDTADLFSADEEEEANDFAANLLVPPEKRASLLKIPTTSQSVIRFAVEIGVSPGVVVGQLQHLGRLGQNRLNRLKRRFKWNATAGY